MRDEAKRWESRVNELLLKYGSVDLAEHNRVADALKVRSKQSEEGGEGNYQVQILSLCT